MTNHSHFPIKSSKKIHRSFQFGGKAVENQRERGLTHSWGAFSLNAKFGRDKSVGKNQCGNRDNECKTPLFSSHFPSSPILADLSPPEGNSVKRAVENLIIPESAR